MFTVSHFFARLWPDPGWGAWEETSKFVWAACWLDELPGFLVCSSPAQMQELGLDSGLPGQGLQQCMAGVGWGGPMEVGALGAMEGCRLVGKMVGPRGT